MRLLWLGAISCNGNSHSVLNSREINKILNDFTLIYHPVIETNYTLKNVVEKTLPCDVLIVEGALSNEFERYGVSIEKTLKKYAKKAKQIITLGSCASFGGIFKESFSDASGMHFKGEEEIRKFTSYKDKTITLAGCPVMPEVLINTLYQIKAGLMIKKDNLLRPKEFFAYSVHNGCTRNEYFEYKIDSHSLGKSEGCMFYDYGCQAPFTRGVCNKILWNGVNSKTRAGSPCFGCNEPSFPRDNLFETKKSMGVPKLLPTGVPKRAYLSIAGVSKSFKIPRLHKGMFDD